MEPGIGLILVGTAWAERNGWAKSLLELSLEMN